MIERGIRDESVLRIRATVLATVLTVGTVVGISHERLEKSKEARVLAKINDKLQVLKRRTK